jgi:AGZA family xanthine/uracil permease-like MFS transporter
MKQAFDRFFGIRAMGSSIPVEILGGVSTFLSLSYIFVVNPAILAEAGMDRSAVLFATITASSLATLFMALWARLPFVLAPGMEMNAYVAFFVCGTLGFTWQQGLGAVFWSGVIFLILTSTGLRRRVIDSIPHRMKAGLAFCVGAFLAVIGLKLAGVLVYEGVVLRGFGSPLSREFLALLAGLGIALLLERLGLRAAILIAIGLTAILCHAIGLGERPTAPLDTTVSGGPLSALAKLDLSVIFDPRILSVILILFVVDFYGSVAKFIGLTEETPIMRDGQVPRIGRALWVDGAAAMGGAALGTTSITTYVESAVGIGVGARTGLAALVCGLLMLACFAFAPLLAWIPIHATTGVLVLIGIKLCPPLKSLRGYTRTDRVLLTLMLLVTAVTFSIDRPMLLGFLGYISLQLASRSRPDPFLIFSTVLLLAAVLLQTLS